MIPISTQPSTQAGWHLGANGVVQADHQEQERHAARQRHRRRLGAPGQHTITGLQHEQGTRRHQRVGHGLNTLIAASSRRLWRKATRASAWLPRPFCHTSCTCSTGNADSCRCDQGRNRHAPTSSDGTALSWRVEFPSQREREPSVQPPPCEPWPDRVISYRRTLPRRPCTYRVRRRR